MELSCGFFLLLDGHVEVIEGLVEVVQLVVKEASEEVETRLLLVLAAALDRGIEEF